MKTQNRWQKAVILSLLAIALFLAGCAKGASPAGEEAFSPERIIQNFIGAINEKNLDRVDELMSSEMVYVENYGDGSQYREENREAVLAYVRELMDNETVVNVASINKLTGETWEVGGRYTDFLTELLELPQGIGFQGKFILDENKVSSVEYTYNREDEILAEQQTEGVIGVALKDDNGRVIIKQCDAGMPAAKSGLQSGDLIEAVDGCKVAEMKHGYTEARYRIRGQAGSKVNLTINRNEKVFDVKMTRVKDPSQEGMKIINEYETVLAYYEGLVKLDHDSVPEEVKDRNVYYYLEDTEASPREYYYLKETGVLYLLKEGCWFAVNEDYINVTPQGSELVKAADEMRETLQAESKKARTKP